MPTRFALLRAIRVSEDLTMPEAAALRSISEYAVQSGGVLVEAFPSLATVADDMCSSRSTAKRAVRSLESKGWLTIREGERASHRYTIRIPEGVRVDPPRVRVTLPLGSERPPKTPVEDPKEDNTSFEQDEPTTGETMNPTDHPDLFAPQKAEGPSGEAKTTDPTTEDTSTPRKASPAEWRSCMDLWVKLSKEAGKRGTPYQRRAKTGSELAARIQEHGVDAVHRVLRWHRRSFHPRAVFLREHGSPLTTLVRPDNFVTYLEMAHGDRAAEERPEVAQVVQMPKTEEERNAWRRARARAQFAPKATE